MARRKEPKIPDAILDQLLGGADPKTAFDPNGLLDDLKKALAERALNVAEIDHHLAERRGWQQPKRLRQEDGGYRHRSDRAGCAERSAVDLRSALRSPSTSGGFLASTRKIISMYARGMSVGGVRREVQPRRHHWFLERKVGFIPNPRLPLGFQGQSRLGEKEYRALQTPGVALRPRIRVREIVGHLRDLYGVDVSPDLISAVTDAVLDEVAAWQGGKGRPSNPSTRWSFSTLCASKSGTKGWCAIRPCMSR